MTAVMEIPDLAARRADLSPETVALVDTGDDVERTYAELVDRVGRAADLLRGSWGLAPGDRVVVLAENRAATIELLLAGARTGVVLVPLNWRLAVPELRGIVDDCEPRALIHGPELADPAAALVDHLGDVRTATFGRDPDGTATSYEEAIATADPGAVPSRARDAGETWYLLYTSGTTGRPKGVVQTFQMALVNHLNIGTAIELTASDTTLNVLPQFHTGGLNLYTLPTLLAGGTAIVQRAFDPAETLELLAGRTTAFFGVPAIYQALAADPGFADADLSGVRSWLSGGAPAPVALLERYAERGIVIQQGFGMTETGPTVFVIDRAHAVSKAGSVGKPQLLVDVRIVDRDGDDVAAGEAGELWIRGPGVTPGYHERPDAQDEAFTADGWLRSGDVARADDDGYYYIVDRWKDMFISGGENVFPAEVEQVLHDHRHVAEAAVVGVPDERWGEVGLAVVVAEDAGDAADLAEVLRERCRAALAAYKVPASFRFVDELPRNAAGKVRKDELVRRFAPAGDDGPDPNERSGGREETE